MAIFATWRFDQGTDDWWLYLLASATIPLVGINAVRSSILRGLGHAFSAQVPELLIKPLVSLAALAGLWWAGSMSVFNAMWVQLLALEVALLVGTHLLWRNQPSEANGHEAVYQNRAWLGALLPFSLIAAVGVLNDEIGVLALGSLSTDAEVAVLKIAQSGAMLVSTVLVVVH